VGNDYFHPEQEELLWEVEMEHGITEEGRLVNARYGSWNVSSEPETVWRLETILCTPTPPRPRPPPVTVSSLRRPFRIT
jgi:hypothetical protein